MDARTAKLAFEIVEHNTVRVPVTDPTMLFLDPDARLQVRGRYWRWASGEFRRLCRLVLPGLEQTTTALGVGACPISDAEAQFGIALFNSAVRFRYPKLPPLLLCLHQEVAALRPATTDDRGPPGAPDLAQAVATHAPSGWRCLHYHTTATGCELMYVSSGLGLNFYWHLGGWVRVVPFLPWCPLVQAEATTLLGTTAFTWPVGCFCLPALPRWPAVSRTALPRLVRRCFTLPRLRRIQLRCEELQHLPSSPEWVEELNQEFHSQAILRVQESFSAYSTLLATLVLRGGWVSTTTRGTKTGWKRGVAKLLLR